jgi:hypothetical protein
MSCVDAFNSLPQSGEAPRGLTSRGAVARLVREGQENPGATADFVSRSIRSARMVKKMPADGARQSHANESRLFFEDTWRLVLAACGDTTAYSNLGVHSR